MFRVFIIAVFSGSLIISSFNPALTQTIGYVVKLKDEVRSSSRGRDRKLSLKSPLSTGKKIMTKDDSSAVLALKDDSIIYLAEMSTLRPTDFRLAENGSREKVGFFLEKGKALFYIWNPEKDKNGSQPLETLTPLVRVYSNAGANIVVHNDWNNTTEVICIEGETSISNPVGRKSLRIKLDPLQTLRIRSDEPFNNPEWITRDHYDEIIKEFDFNVSGYFEKLRIDIIRPDDPYPRYLNVRIEEKQAEGKSGGIFPPTDEEPKRREFFPSQ